MCPLGDLLGVVLGYIRFCGELDAPESLVGTIDVDHVVIGHLGVGIGGIVGEVGQKIIHRRRGGGCGAHIGVEQVSILGNCVILQHRVGGEIFLGAQNHHILRAIGKGEIRLGRGDKLVGQRKLQLLAGEGQRWRW